MRRIAPVLALVLAALVPVACGADEQEAGAPPSGNETRLRVEVTEASAKPIQMQLVCRDRCDVARLREALAERRGTQACTLQYGGPEKAHVTGRLEGRPVDVTLDRADGCGIAAYEALFAAFGRQPPIAR